MKPSREKANAPRLRVPELTSYDDGSVWSETAPTDYSDAWIEQAPRLVNFFVDEFVKIGSYRSGDQSAFC